MRKWLFFLLAIVTAANSLIPCCGIDECCADQFTTSPNQDRHQSEGTCSPFFACATCAGFVSLSKHIQLTEVSIEREVHFEQKINFNLSTFASSFWQPPRIS